MATFPSLQPATRTFTPGRHPHSVIPTLSGLQTRVRTSNVILEQRLRLTFTALTEAEMLSIRNHYIQQQGRFLSFTIPADLLSGTGTPSAFTPTGYNWLYADRPQITDIGLQRYDVSIDIVTTPFDGANLNGVDFTLATSLSAGIATVPLLDLLVGVSFAAGTATAGDSDAAAYIAAVEAADGQTLETGVKTAINTFVAGCKSDGIWNAIKASCILAGARTLGGALVPLVGTAPTNVGGLFVSGDYNRKTGLVGDGSTKYLDSNRNNNADPQNSNHNAAYATAIGSVNGTFVASNSVTDAGTNAMLGGTGNTFFTRNRTSTGTANAAIPLPGFVGTDRSSSASYIQRVNGSNSLVSVTSQTPFNSNVFIFARGSGAPTFATHRIAFYSIGESLDLALLDTRVTALINAIAAAIP